MKYLLDTHILLWSIEKPEKLSKTVINILKDSKNEIFVSAVSLWEITLKYSLGNLEIKNKIPEDLIFKCFEMGYALIDLTSKETVTFYRLAATHHKDPFDRILIWQAIKNDFIFLSDDKNVQKYISEGLRVIA